MFDFPQNRFVNCPFCGSNCVGYPFNDRPNYWVTCYECDADGPLVPKGDAKVDLLALCRWNNRKHV